MIKIPVRFFCPLLNVFMLSLVAPVSGQVFDPGPSDPALFDTVIDLPPTPNLGGNIGGDGMTTQVNVADGGRLTGSTDILAGAEVNLIGGSVGPFLDVRNGGELTLSGGSIDLAAQVFSGGFVTITGGNTRLGFEARSGSTVNFNGGTVGQRFDAQSGSNVTITGSRLELNGQPIIDLLDPQPVFVDLQEGDILTGALVDNSAFIFSHEGRDRLNNVRFVPIDATIVSPVPIVVDTPNPDRPSGLLEGQTMILRDGGILGENFEVVNATLNIEGGFLDEGLGLSGGVANMTGGESDVFTEIYDGSTVNISGGSFGGFLDVFSGGELNVSGGSLGGFSVAHAGSVVNISGGVVDRNFDALAGSTVNLTGGAVGFGFNVEAGSNVTLQGGEFLVNGTAVSGSTLTLTEGDNFTGTLADGSAFIFSDVLGDEIVGLNLDQVSLPPLDPTPQFVDTINPDRPSGLRQDQTLTLQAGGELPSHFEAVNATLNIEGGFLNGDANFNNSILNMSGGEIDRALTMLGGELNLSGGSIGNQSEFLDGCVVTISGGSIGNEFRFENSVLNVSAGTIDEELTMMTGSIANISGGEFGSDFTTEAGSVVNISGGSFGSDKFFDSDSEVNLSGSNFMLDGVLLDDNLNPGEPMTIDAVDSLLSGTFVDGSEFTFNFSATGSDTISNNATLTITLVLDGEPLLGDINLDGNVNLLDVAPFVDLITAGQFQAEGDINGDGIVNLLDVGPFVDLLTGGGSG